MKCKNFKCINEIDFTKRRSDAQFCSSRCYKHFHNHNYKNKQRGITSSKVGNGSNVIDLYPRKTQRIKNPKTQKDIFANESTGKLKIKPQPVTKEKPDFDPIKFSKKFDFLRVEKKEKGSVFMSLDAPAGAGKTTLLFQIIGDAAKNGNKVLFISLEENPTSALFIEKVNKFWEDESIKNIETIDHVSDKYELIKLCNEYDVIAIDSFGKLPKGIEVDNFRNDVNGAFVISIFQQTNEGKTRGGSAVGYDADMKGKMKVEGEGENKKSWLYFEKMRYYGKKQGELLYNAFRKTTAKDKCEPKKTQENNFDKPFEKDKKFEEQEKRIDEYIKGLKKIFEENDRELEEANKRADAQIKQVEAQNIAFNQRFLTNNQEFNPQTKKQILPSWVKWTLGVAAAGTAIWYLARDK